MPYPEQWVRPAREELTHIGVRELTSATEVDEVLQSEGTVLVVVNSICGCAAGSARPAIAQALEGEGPRPDQVTSVFAGQDLEPTERAREHFRPQPPSSPSIALMRDGKLVFMLHRNRIEGRDSGAIAADLKEAFQTYCSHQEA